MSDVRKIVCQIIDASLFGHPIFTFCDANWPTIYKEFVDQAIVAIPAGILEALPIPKIIEQQWDKSVLKVSARALRLIANQNELIQLLSQSNIPYAILKGVAAAVYYPAPWLRMMGDVDFIVRSVDYDRTKELLLTHGFIPSVDNDNPRHEAFDFNGTHFELHRYFSVEPEESVLDGLIYEQLNDAVEATVFNHTFRMLPGKRSMFRV